MNFITEIYMNYDIMNIIEEKLATQRRYKYDMNMCIRHIPTMKNDYEDEELQIRLEDIEIHTDAKFYHSLYGGGSSHIDPYLHLRHIDKDGNDFAFHIHGRILETDLRLSAGPFNWSFTRGEDDDCVYDSDYESDNDSDDDSDDDYDYNEFYDHDRCVMFRNYYN